MEENGQKSVQQAKNEAELDWEIRQLRSRYEMVPLLEHTVTVMIYIKARHDVCHRNLDVEAPFNSGRIW